MCWFKLLFSSHNFSFEKFKSGYKKEGFRGSMKQNLTQI